MAQENRHLTTEQLSDFLDGKVSLQEQAQWESHLKNCSSCQQELASLLQVVAMLHALPPPALPRSFVLPLETAKSAVLLAASTPIPIGTARRQQWKSYARVTMRIVSTIAAVVGVVFLLSALLSGVMQRGGAASTASNTSSHATTAAAPNVGSTASHPQSSPGVRTATGQAKATPTFNSEATPTLTMNQVQPTSSANPKTVSSSWIDILNLGAPFARLGIGMLLIIFGIMGVVLFKRQPRPRGRE